MGGYTPRRTVRSIQSNTPITGRLVTEDAKFVLLPDSPTSRSPTPTLPADTDLGNVDYGAEEDLSVLHAELPDFIPGIAIEAAPHWSHRQTSRSQYNESTLKGLCSRAVSVDHSHFHSFRLGVQTLIQPGEQHWGIRVPGRGSGEGGYRCRPSNIGRINLRFDRPGPAAPGNESRNHLFLEETIDGRSQHARISPGGKGWDPPQLPLLPGIADLAY